MSLTRRRFLTIAAVCTAAPAAARTHRWQGRAFGGDISLAITGPRTKSEAAIAAARELIAETEQLFSLYDPASDLSRLNRTSTLAMHPQFQTLVSAADAAHRLTGGLFDPSVQPLWQAIADGRDPADAASAIGWNKVRVDNNRITLAPGQALTFNGIAQGFATDRVANWLTEHGFDNTLVNIGEHRATGGHWTLGLEDPQHGHLGTRTLQRGAIATSSPLATPVGRDGHILHPQARPRWSTVSVEADTATLADSLSTGLVLADLPQIRRIRHVTGVSRITLVGPAGDIRSL